MTKAGAGAGAGAGYLGSALDGCKGMVFDLVSSQCD